ncbi:hypothetical protein M2280_003685 [Prescottella agglutinans]|uniref:Uncharacterized protein n=1 Tax=Prescottella agglutinans TaxID=1644129 RepID=A0ABT6MDQ6_9NOCA|nr:hypothetical protein [Prescottella agglutinans]
MLGNYFDGSLNLVYALGNITLIGLYTASSQGAGWQSLG